MSSKKFVSGLLLGISVFSLAGAAIPELPNPLANINLTFDQRLEQMKQTDAALLKATPEERKEYWHKMRDQMKALSPEDRKLAEMKARKAKWENMSPEEKQKWHKQASQDQISSAVVDSTSRLVRILRTRELAHRISRVVCGLAPLTLDTP